MHVDQLGRAFWITFVAGWALLQAEACFAQRRFPPVSAEQETPAADPVNPFDTRPAPPAAAAADPEEPQAPPADKPMQDAGAVEGASSAEDEIVPPQSVTFHGVQPGVTTRDQLEAKWKKPKEWEKLAGGLRARFELEDFPLVRVTVADNVVQSVAIQFEQPAEVAAVVKQLDLEDVDPVDIENDEGKVFGQAYPERGVMLGFANEKQARHVVQAIIEPPDAQSFLVRAEIYLPRRFSRCLADLNQALVLSPDNERAYALHAELQLKTFEWDSALESARKAVDLAPAESDCQLTLARVLTETGNCEEAIAELRKLAASPGLAAVQLARAHALLGDAIGASGSGEYGKAFESHSKAIKLAQPLVDNQKVAVRRAAKLVLLNAHLGVARDLARGNWQNKTVAVPKWIGRAVGYMDDIAAHEGGTNELQISVLQQALGALAGLADPPNPTEPIGRSIELAEKMLADNDDPAYKANIHWQLAVSLSYGVEILAARKQHDEVLAIGQRAIEQFEACADAMAQVPNRDYLRGRVCYRLGTVYAPNRGDRQPALAWFEKAVPLLQTAVQKSGLVESGRRGEMLVSIGVTYWELGKRPEALQLTQQGVALLERAAADGAIAKSTLKVPYGNLASMHQQMGEAEPARRYVEMAAQADATPIR